MASTHDSDCVARSIGSLLSRPALRNLEIEFEGSFEEEEGHEIYHEPVMNIFRCPTVKPELEHLKLDFSCNIKNLSLTSIHEFVKDNFNLKSLTLYGMEHFNNEKANKTVIQDIIKILDCDHGLETVNLGSVFRPRSYTDIKRNEFPQVIEYLRTRVSETLNAEAQALI